MNANARGLTLVEILVAVSVFTIGISLSAGLLTSLRMAPRTAETLNVTQASAQWLENATNAWSPPSNFGNLALLTPIPAVTGTTWSAQVCTVDASVTPEVVTCGAAVTTGLPKYVGGATLPGSATLVRLNLRYTPTTGAATTTSLELAKR